MIKSIYKACFVVNINAWTRQVCVIYKQIQFLVWDKLTSFDVKFDKCFVKLTRPADAPVLSADNVDPVSSAGNDARDFWRISDILDHTLKHKGAGKLQFHYVLWHITCWTSLQ